VIKQASSLNLFKDEFEAGDKGAVLKVRDQTPDNAKKIQAKLEKYKDTVKKELLTSDKRALEALTPDELLARMEEATYWKANKQFLYGKTWRGSKEMAKLRDVLITVEAEYTAAFEKKVSEKLEKKGIGGEFVRLATQKVIKSKKGLGRSRYDFHKNLPNGKTAYDVIEVEILDNGKKMEKAAVKKSKVVMTGREGVSSGTVEGHASFNSVEEAEGELNQAMELQNRIGKIKNKLKIEFDEEMFERAQSPNGIEDDLNDFQVSSIPDQKWELKVIDNQIISAHPSTPLLPNTNYTIKIIWKDKTIHQFVIRTEDTQTDYELLKKLDDELARDYPLARLVPYEESAYRVIYLEPLTLGITIQNPNLTSSEVIEEIKKWVKDNGGDPEKHSYKITPSATP